MQTNRIERNLAACRASSGRCVLPFLTAGCPDCEATAELIRRADALGAPVVEIGYPFSDSIADGPVIAQSFHAALRGGHTVARTFQLIADVRPDVNCALVAMVSFSIVHRIGVDRFMYDAAGCGFDGVILPDVPVEEHDGVRAQIRRAGLCHVGLVAPTTAPQRREAIARAAQGFVYQIAVAGTTGERNALPPSLGADVAGLRAHTALPICVGFGISSHAQVRAVCAVADGAIVGSAIMRRVLTALHDGQSSTSCVEVAGAFLEELMSGRRRAAEPRVPGRTPMAEG